MLFIIKIIPKKNNLRTFCQRARQFHRRTQSKGRPRGPGGTALARPSHSRPTTYSEAPARVLIHYIKHNGKSKQGYKNGDINFGVNDTLSRLSQCIKTRKVTCFTCEEVHGALSGEGLGHERLGAARGTIQQHSLGGCDAQGRKQLGMQQGPLHHLIR